MTEPAATAAGSVVARPPTLGASVPARLAHVVSVIRDDVAAARRNDPAAGSDIEVVLLYPGLHAIWAYRGAHALWRRSVLLRPLARAVSQLARAVTGIEIHPGAQLGPRLFIDHGMGVVIGETAVVGADVMLYHGVTLGGRTTSPGKRHPTLEDNVTVGAGAKILGPITIGEGARIGANAVVVHDVPADAVAVGVPARVRRVAVVDPFEVDPAIYI